MRTHIYFIFSLAYLRSGGRLFDKVLLDAVENWAANFLASLFDILSFLSCQMCGYFCEADDAKRKNCTRRKGREGDNWEFQMPRSEYLSSNVFQFAGRQGNKCVEWAGYSFWAELNVYVER